MLFEWDEAKRRRNLKKHGVDFVAMLYGFDGRPALDWQDRRRPYGEERRNRLVLVQDALFHITYTRRAESVRLISARKASKRERETYHQNLD